MRSFKVQSKLPASTLYMDNLAEIQRELFKKAAKIAQMEE